MHVDGPRGSWLVIPPSVPCGFSVATTTYRGLSGATVGQVNVGISIPSVAFRAWRPSLSASHTGCELQNEVTAQNHTVRT